MFCNVIAMMELGVMEDKTVEIKQVSEREIWIGESRFYLGEDDILYETLVGKQDLETTIAIMEIHDKFRSLVEGNLNVLIDLNKTGQPTSQARKTGMERLEKVGYGKVAMFGMHPVARVLASFIMGVTKKEDLRFFKTNEEALAWLKE